MMVRTVHVAGGRGVGRRTVRLITSSNSSNVTKPEPSSSIIEKRVCHVMVLRVVQSVVEGVVGGEHIGMQCHRGREAQSELLTLGS